MKWFKRLICRLRNYHVCYDSSYNGDAKINCGFCGESIRSLPYFTFKLKKEKAK